jgi:hypothetical protein
MIEGNKRYPSDIKNEVEKALSYYPELADSKIHFRWGVFTQYSFMLAQPKIPTLLRKKENRAYQIIIRKKFFLKNNQFANGRIPSDVMIGWLGHELGHVLDYRERSSWNLIWFGIRYYFSTSFLKKAEITADKNAAEHGLIAELVVSKEFGRDPKYFSMSYVNKLNGLYPSVEDVKEWAAAVIS